MGMADDPGGDGALALDDLDGRQTPDTPKTSLAGDPGGMADDPGGDGALALAKRAWRANLAGPADDPDQDGGRRHSGDWRALAKSARRANLAGTPLDLALARATARRTRRTTLAVDSEDSGEDDAGTVTHHARRSGRSRTQNPFHSPASGGCGWVPRYEDGAIHDHSMGGARRSTVTHPKPQTLIPEPS